MRELSDSFKRITHITKRKKSTYFVKFVKKKKKAVGAEMLLKNITHLFFPTEMCSNALGDKCAEEMQ